jgi:hypothetical protein
VTAYRLVAEPGADLDVAAAWQWYEDEQAGLGLEFLDELRATYDRIADGPFKYQDLSGLALAARCSDESRRCAACQRASRSAGHLPLRSALARIGS